MGRFSKLETHQPTQPDTPEAEPEELALEEEPQPDYGAEPLSYEATMRRADEVFYQGEWKKSLRYYSRALSLDNTHVTPWVGQVFALIFMKQLREADVWARRGTDCFPDHPVTASLRGLVFVLQGMVRRGLASSDYAMGLGEADTICWITRGWMLLEADNRNWTGCLDKATEMCPPDAWRHYALMALILERHRKWPQAAEKFRRALDTQTRGAFLWHRLGLCYKRMGLNRKAFEAQENALALDPDFAAADDAARKASGFSLVGAIRGLFKRSA